MGVQPIEGWPHCALRIIIFFRAGFFEIAAMNKNYPRLLGIFLAAFLAEASAQTIYRCGSPGHITLTDQPCDGSRPPPVAAGAAASHTSGQDAPEAAPPGAPTSSGGRAAAEPIGAWRGNGELLLNVSDKPVALSPNSNALSLAIGADGKLQGSLREQACQLTGKLTSDYGGGQHAVVAKFANCRDPRLNLNYTGTLAMAPVGRPSRLVLSGFGGFLGGAAPTSASLRAELNRHSTGILGVGH